MIGDLLYYTSEQLPSIFTGLTMMIVGISVYEVGDGWFLSGGQFRGKYEALVIMVGCLFTASLFTPVINSFWADILPQLAPGQIVGGLIVLGMFTLNSVTGWNHFEPKAGAAYALGGLLFVEPSLIHLVI